MAKKVTLSVAFSIGQKVLFNSKVGKDEGVVAAYSVRGKSPSVICYAVVWSNKNESYHYDFELTAQ